MNAQKIRATKFECDDGAWECAKWLQEIAAQLAYSNEAAIDERQKAERFRERIGGLQENLQRLLAIFTINSAESKPS